MRHCWFTRMLYCPLRSPRSFSSRLPGGTVRSSRTSAASRISNFRSAARCVGGIEAPGTLPSPHSLGVLVRERSQHRHKNNVKRYAGSLVTSGWREVHGCGGGRNDSEWLHRLEPGFRGMISWLCGTLGTAPIGVLTGGLPRSVLAG